MIHIETLTFNPLQENTYIVYDEAGDCMIVDPGCYEAYEQKELTDFIAKKKLTVRLLVNTHGHIDHVLGNYFVKETYKVPFEIFHLDAATLQAVGAYAPNYGFFQYTPATPDRLLKEGDAVIVGSMKFDILFVPGHAPGHIAFVNTAEKICLSGDVLFRSSIGRADLPGGNYDTLIHSIKTKLFLLPDDTIVYPGHGPTTTIQFEKKHNPYCAL
ncbi:MBL fold metallo-hydrolase [Cytophaga hutchinsonii]|uniref:Metallo-beta-lactamase family protein n=1 Tax=Cytophaga hutchinsonii (strain ATCC 33406 / DSM 1761 / CIP 103989 / NBRC 15051 / NCIMB 9469 / D465) TaxID=269798 RepID=A0A6N4SVB6_CYTH3|nr:MBL fold metallo-hydrolase [Cytophaga hutchinsonii]ABG60475.1 metallo-beta-lactamase family protein [Cytophaga hutchinsonii ATCC 33406]SFX85156.1 Glyoxylase, beta-lactamase superfamily II [Cytophaga hutchinsonii ATCC 33406]